MILLSTIENYLCNAYSLNFPGRDVFKKTSWNPELDTKNAADVNAVLMKFSASDQEIYFSFLKQALEKHSDIPVNDVQLNDEIIRAMYQHQVEYSRLIRCMMYAPRFANIPEESRWIMASTRVTNVINPLLALPEIACAKPIVQLNIVKDTDREIYFAHLKNVFEQNPAQRLDEADKRVIHLLKDNGLSDERITNCIKNSQQFPETEYTLGKFALTEEQTEKICTYVKETMAENTTLRPVAKPAMSDAELYQTMQKRLREMKAMQSQDVLEYWSKAMSVMQQTMVQINQSKMACRIVAIWSVGLEKVSQGFGLPLDPAVQKIQEESKKMLEQASETEQDWSRIYTMMEKVDEFSQKIMRETSEICEKSPLLKRPEVQKAVAMGKERDITKLSLHELYWAAVKEAAVKNVGIGLYEADVKAIDILRSKGKCNERMLQKCLTFSPRLNHLNSAQRNVEVKRFLEFRALKEKESAR